MAVGANHMSIFGTISHFPGKNNDITSKLNKDNIIMSGGTIKHIIVNTLK
ncbi:hypothetical protein OkiPb00122_11120 [Escherichia coli]